MVRSFVAIIFQMLILSSVKHYDSKSGYLYLAHEYPKLQYQSVARVNIDHVLESIRNCDVQIGAWLNVIGYTCGRAMDPLYPFDVGRSRVYSEIGIQAIILWNAESVDVGSYEKALEARKKAGTTG